MENNRAIAVNARSPPDNKLRFCSFFPGGCATISTPVFNKSSGFVNLNPLFLHQIRPGIQIQNDHESL